MKIPSQFCGPTMEENSPSTNHNGQIGPSSGSTNIGNKANEDGSQITQYSIPGILHFIQHEWARFEMERSQWEVDRSELQARIAFLQGERKGQENLKHDLVRRIKMLEYALKQERAKCHKLKYGSELQQGEMKPSVGLYDDVGESGVSVDVEAPYTAVSNITWRQGRQILRQYLQEIGYSDTIIDVRSNRVRSLLGLNNNAENEENINNASGSINGNEASNKRTSETQGRRTASKKTQPAASLTEAMILDTEAAVMANFEFLAREDVDMEEDEMSDDMDDQPDDDSDDVKTTKRKPKIKNEALENDVDVEAEEVLNELNRLTETSGVGEGDDTTDWGQRIRYQSGTTQLRPMSDEDNLDCALGLGELAQLTVNNEEYDIVSTKESFRKTWNAKYTLRSHFDCVRALAFHPEEPVLITASEDNTLKLWNLQKTVPAKKSTSLDVEPLYTFRCHTGPVLTVAMSTSGEHCYSGGLDGAIHCWSLPSPNIDPYDSFDPHVLTQSLGGHTNAVWGLSVDTTKPHLVSCSADGTVKLWAPHIKDPLLNTFKSETDGTPTCVDFVRDEPNRIVAGYNSSHCMIFDTETSKSVVRLDSSQDVVNNVLGRPINRLVCHPSLPLTMTAHEDRYIRFFDNNTGKLVHSMVAHLDAVTSLAVDPNGLFLLSGSHDCSIRLWNLDNKTCVQEITAHRKKFDESILDVAFHPTRPYIATAGADGLAKVFV